MAIDIYRGDLKREEREGRSRVREMKEGGEAKIVVIDPGHGGEDPGAIGPQGSYEKDVVLEISKELKRILEEGGGDIRVFLTRRGDYFIPLSERIKIAKEYGADLFLSIHANGSFNPNLRGSSAYCLSFEGASSVRARLLAQRENTSDLVGGVRKVAFNKDVNAILLDLIQTETINQSLRLAGITLKELQGVNELELTTPQQAPFAVLKALDFPAILIETAYITNPEEEERLKREDFQRRIAEAISHSVCEFLYGAQKEVVVQSREKPKTHIVEKGETLWRIAKRYGTTVWVLKEANNLEDITQIPMGKDLIIP